MTCYHYVRYNKVGPLIKGLAIKFINTFYVLFVSKRGTKHCSQSPTVSIHIFNTSLKGIGIVNLDFKINGFKPM